LDSISGEFTSSINHTQQPAVEGTSYEVPIFAENTAANKVKAFAITTNAALDVCKLVDASNVSQFDIYAGLGSSMPAGTYIFPTGSGPFRLDSGQKITIAAATGKNDITDLIFSTVDAQNSLNIQASIIYDK
jgi:hypothetical protein